MASALIIAQELTPFFFAQAQRRNEQPVKISAFTPCVAPPILYPTDCGRPSSTSQKWSNRQRFRRAPHPTSTSFPSSAKYSKDDTPPQSDAPIPNPNSASPATSRNPKNSARAACRPPLHCPICPPR